MNFPHFDAAQQTVKVINEELRFFVKFGELNFPAKACVRCQRKRGVVTWSLSDYLATVACAVPSGCKVTYTIPTTQLGMDALAIIKLHYPNAEAKKKGEEQLVSNQPLPLPKRTKKK